MKFVKVRDFRSCQAKYLKMAREGQEIMLISRLGMFRIIPMDDEDEGESEGNNI